MEPSKEAREVAFAAATQETARLSREMNITNADHIALWIEANTIPDEPMNQCASWLACRIVEAHERAIQQYGDQRVAEAEARIVELEALVAEHVKARKAMVAAIKDLPLPITTAQNKEIRREN